MNGQFPDMAERVARALYAQWSEFVFKHLQTELRRFDELGDDLKATWIDRADAALEASHHAELVEALREMVNIASSLAVAFNYTDPDAYLAMGEARTLLLAKISGNSPTLEEGDAQP